jgi:hypothetical protein
MRLAPAVIPLLAVACMLTGPAPLHAQDATRTVTGRARDMTGVPLLDVTVRLSRHSVAQIVRTDNAGRFRFARLTDGEYAVSAVRVEFVPIVDSITVTPGAPSAKEAHMESAAGRRSGIFIARSTCVFVNGRPRPGLPFDALRAADIEFLEAYGPGADISRTLLARWPPDAPCGSPGPTEQGSDPRWRAEYVSVWTREGR